MKMRSTCISVVAGVMAATVAALRIPKAGLVGRQAANDNIVYITECVVHATLPFLYARPT